MITFLFVISAFAWSLSNCEPPANNYLHPNGVSSGRPSSQYGPPGSEQGRPGLNNGRSGQNGNNRQPQDTYGPPGDINLGDGNQGFRSRSGDFDGGSGRSNNPSSQYGAPNSNQQSQGAAPPQTNYGTPNRRQGSNGGQGSQTGGRPNNGNSPNDSYGAPNRRQGSNGGQGSQTGGRPNNGNSPNDSYGAPNRRQGSNGGQGSQTGGRPNNGNSPNDSYGAPQFGQPNGNTGFPIIEDFQPPPNTAVPVPSTPLRAYEESYEDRPPMTGSNSRLRGGAPPSDSYGAPVFERPDSRSDSLLNGQNDSGEQDNEPAKYEFNYDVDDPQTGTQFGHTEQRNGDITSGEYNVLLPDGRKQVVEYEAGHQGFKPQIRYEGGGNGFGGGGTKNEFGRDNQGYQGNSALSREMENFSNGGSTLGYPQGGPKQEINQGNTRAGQRGGEQNPSNDFPPFGDKQSSGEMGYPRGRPENDFTPPARGGNFPQNFNGFSSGDSTNRGTDQSSQGYPSGRPNGGNFNGQGNNIGQRKPNNGDRGSQGYPSGKPNGNNNGPRTQNNGDRGAQGYPSGRPNSGNFNGQGNNNDQRTQNNRDQGSQGYPAGQPNGSNNGQRRQNNGDQGAQGYSSGRSNNGNFNGQDNNNDRKPQGSGGRGTSDGDSGYPSGGPNGARGTGY